MKTKHTQGEWTAEQYDIGRKQILIESEGKIISEVETELRNIEEAEANAKLIAAAPEMLLMLNRLLSNMKILSNEKPNHKGLKHDIKDIRKTIKKATK